MVVVVEVEEEEVIEGDEEGLGGGVGVEVSVIRFGFQV